MKSIRGSGLVALCLSSLLYSGCGTLEAATAQVSPPPTYTPSADLSPLAQNTNVMGTALFLDADSSTKPPSGGAIGRSRWVKIDSQLLLDPQKKPVDLPAGTEIMLNLFPDTTYVGVIERVEQQGGTYTWVGHLKDKKMSTLLIVYAAGVFIGHFASPGSVYEVSSAGGDLYKVIQIDQTKMPGGEGDVKTHA